MELGDALLYLPLLPRLRRLSLGGTRVTGDSFHQLAHLQDLRCLSCKGCSLLTDAGLGLLLLVPGLEELDVAECHGSDGQGPAC